MTDTDRDETLRDLAELLRAELHDYPVASYRRTVAIAGRLGIGEDDETLAIEAALRKALGPPADEGSDRELDRILGDTYTCSRSWSAWELGTMTEEDFEEAAHSAVVDDLLAWRDAAVAEAHAAEAEPAPPALAARVTEILSASGYTDSRSVFPGGFIVTEGPGWVTTGWLVVSVPWADASDGERLRLLKLMAAELRAHRLEVRERERHLQVRARPGEADDDA